MASVYKAYDTRLERDVAVKIIRTDMFIPAALQQVMKRFEREAKSLAKLSHPNIVSIIDYGEHAGVPYLVMEYLPGGNLKDRLKGQPLPWQDSIRLLLPIVRALQFSHQQGIIHRDVKPSNILITLSGEPMLSDFGIAKILESEGSTALTGIGVGIGTPEYMAPEQWVGKTGPQSDLYSLGVVFYEMVTGRKPFSGDTPAAILLKQANDPLPRPKQYAPGLPEKVEKVILKALAKKPENRYPGMQEFMIALENLLSGPAKIRMPAVPPERQKAEESHPPEYKILVDRQQIGEQPTLDAQSPTLDARPPMIGKPAKPVYQADESDKIKIASHKIQLGQTLRLGKIKVRPAWIIALVGLVVLFAFARWVIPPLIAGSTHTPASSGYVYFTSDESGKPEVYYLDPQGVKKQVTHTPGAYQSWSPMPAPGGYVYFTSDESGKPEVYYLDPQGVKKQVTHTPGQYQSWSPAPAPGGYVYFTSDESGKAEVYYLDPQGVKKQVTHTPGQYKSWSPMPAPGGYVYFTSDESGKPEVYYLDPQGVKKQVTHTPGAYQSWSPAPAPGGYVYFTSDESGKPEVYYLDPQGVKKQVTHTPGQYQSWSPAPAPGGYVYFTSDESGKAEVYYLDPQGVKKQVTHTLGYHKSWIGY